MKGNLPMSSYFHPHLEARSIDDKGGMGVFAAASIRKGELLALWEGKFVTLAEAQTLSPEIFRLTIQVEEEFYQIPFGNPEPGDYFNHSCDPNAGLSGQVGLVALRDIQPGEEVCFDYAMCDGSVYDEFDCRCGSALCRGRVSGSDWKRPELQQRYRGYFSPYLQRRMAAQDAS